MFSHPILASNRYLVAASRMLPFILPWFVDYAASVGWGPVFCLEMERHLMRIEFLEATYYISRTANTDRYQTDVPFAVLWPCLGSKLRPISFGFNGEDWTAVEMKTHIETNLRHIIPNENIFVEWVGESELGPGTSIHYFTMHHGTFAASFVHPSYICPRPVK